jgi:hypothetical protein
VLLMAVSASCILLLLLLLFLTSSFRPQDSVSGEPAWASKSVDVGAGSHAAAFCYIKDNSVAAGDDLGEIRNWVGGVDPCEVGGGCLAY